MAQQYVSKLGTLTIPGAYSSYEVQPANAGLATTGVLMLVGEAASGESFSQIDDLDEVTYGPDQEGDVVARFGSGNLVDAFRIAVAPSSDPAIQGGPSRLVLAKTNTSTRAFGALGGYGTLYDKSYGTPGNHIYAGVTANTSETVPTTGSFTYIPPVGSATIRTSNNGVISAALSLTAKMTPTAFVSLIDGVSGVGATGGAARALALTTGNPAITLALAVTGGNNVVITYAGSTFGVTPQAGDTLVITDAAPASVLKGGSDQNVGAYVITSATSSTINATKLSDAGTAPANVSAVPLTDANDIFVYSPVVIAQDAGAVIDGLGKSLEIAQVSGTDSLANCCYVLGTTTKVGWVSTSASPYVLTSASEYSAKLTVQRATDAVNEEITAGGQIALKLSYKNSSASAASCTISATTLTTTVTGVGGADLSLTLSQFPTLSDLAAYINNSTDYQCAVGTTTLGQMAPTTLDRGTFDILSLNGAKNARIKMDAHKFFTALSEQSAVVQLGDPAARAAAGVPAVVATFKLSGGTKGATTAQNVVDAIAALEMVDGNFLVPLFSRDAGFDKADGLTDAASTYVISGVHTAAKNHVVKMSTLKQRKNRQAILAIDDTFSNQKDAAANTASFRCNMVFQNDKALDSTGAITQFGSWMAAVHAAAMQAAGFYKAIFNKSINSNGFIQAAGDFNDKSIANVEDALLAGLMPVKRAKDGSWRFVSDQTTYGRDSNFVYNSLQAVYAADVVALTTAERMENAFVGESLADVSAAVALSYFETIMSDMMRIKLIAPSIDAPFGYKNVSIVISGGVMVVSAEIKLAGALYFIPITFRVSPVQQVA